MLGLTVIMRIIIMACLYSPEPCSGGEVELASDARRFAQDRDAGSPIESNAVVESHAISN